MSYFLFKHTMMKYHSSPMARRNQIGREGEITWTAGHYNFPLGRKEGPCFAECWKFVKNRVERNEDSRGATVGVKHPATSDIEVSTQR